MRVKVAIAGGGPAGMVLGFLLARAGVEVAVLEKHADFLRDFRGDTVHPSTLEIMWELGLLEAFLALPHSEITQFSAVVDDHAFPFVDLRYVPTHCKFLAFMPQWDFLNFLAGRARNYPAFHLLMQTEAIETIENEGRVAGIRARSPQGEIDIFADVTVGADGRHSTLRKAARLPAKDFGAAIDVLWLRIPREPGDPAQVFGYIKNGKIFVMLMRDTYWQCAYVIPKGGFDALKARGLDGFRADVAHQAPFVASRLDALRSWDDVKLLTVQVDRLEKWSVPGMVFIGDAAHAMSPIGGVGINLAVQDAVAAANILYQDLAAGCARLGGRAEAACVSDRDDARLAAAHPKRVHGADFARRCTERESIRETAGLLASLQVRSAAAAHSGAADRRRLQARTRTDAGGRGLDEQPGGC